MDNTKLYQKTFRELVNRQHLPLKLLKVATNPESGRVTFFFSSPKRVDFRKLLSDLQDSLGCSVELRQAGPREQAASLGGVGICGHQLCCAGWLPKPLNVPTKTLERIKEPLTMSQITGVCGKLLCCLLYETEDFKCPAQERLPIGVLPQKSAEKNADRPDLNSEPNRTPKESTAPQPSSKPPRRRRVRRLIHK